MSEEFTVGCVRPELQNKAKETETTTRISNEEDYKEEGQKMIKVGKPAPLFSAPAFHKGQFTNVKLEDFKGKWVLLCFYPGDFTFV